MAAASALLFIPNLPLAVTILAATALSLGFDLTHPLLAGVSTSLDPTRRGQAMGLNTFAIFLGLGLGSLIFGQLTVHFGIAAFAMFAGFQIGIGLLSLRAFKKE